MLPNLKPCAQPRILVATILFYVILASGQVFVRVGNGTDTSTRTTSSTSAFSCPSNVEIESPALHGSTLHGLSESQPDNFKCDLRYKTNAIVLFDVYTLLTLVNALASLAVRNFDEPIQVYRFGMYGMELRLLSTREPGRQGYQVKTVMWSLRIMSCWMHLNEDRYAELSFLSKYDQDPELGYGQLVSVPTPPLGENSTTIAPSIPLSNPATAREQGDLDNNDEITITNLIIDTSGATFTPFDMYSCLINVLIGEGELDPQGVQHELTAYNRAANLSFGLGATSGASASNFPNRLVVKAIEVLALRLSLINERALQWKECAFLVRNKGRIIGTGAFKKGEFPEAVAMAKLNGSSLGVLEVS